MSDPAARNLLGSNSLNINNSNPPDTGDANSFTLANLGSFRTSGGAVINPALPNSRITNYNVGPYANQGQWTARNAFTGPGLWNIDLGLYKRIRFTERYSLQLRAEAFNVFNHANLFYDPNQLDASTFNFVSARRGVFPSGNFERRNVQLAAKFIF